MNTLIGDDIDVLLPRCAATSSASSDDCKVANEGFDSLPNALFTSILAATTTNYPSSFIPSYSAYRPTGILWLLFFAVSNFLFLNLVLSVIYNEYSSRFKERVLGVFEKRVKGLREAFCILEAEGGVKGSVSKEQVFALLRELNKIKTIDYIPSSHLNFLFAKLDEDGNNTIDLREFCELSDTIQYSYVRVPSTGWLDAFFSDGSKNWINESMPSWIMVILVLNSFCIVMEDIVKVSE